MDKALEQQGYLTTTVDAVVGWARSNSIMPMPLGLSCCAIEMMATAGPRYDQGRFGAEAVRFSPRQADLMIVAGWVTYKMAHAIRRIWDQMSDPKWCIAMGACASTGGMHRCYGVVRAWITSCLWMCTWLDALRARRHFCMPLWISRRKSATTTRSSSTRPKVRRTCSRLHLHPRRIRIISSLSPNYSHPC